MTVSRHALSNLINRYRAVLRKCRAKNAPGLLAAGLFLAASLCLPSAAAANSGGHEASYQYYGDDPSVPVIIDEPHNPLFDAYNGDSYSDVYGGKVSGSAVQDWRVIVEPGGTEQIGIVRLYGGFTDNGNATGNQVFLKGNTYARDLYVGYTQDGDVIENRLSIDVSGNPHNPNAVGNPGEGFAGYTEKGDARRNQVSVSGIEVSSANNGSRTTRERCLLFSGYTQDGDAVENRFDFSSGTMRVPSSVSAVRRCLVSGYTEKGDAIANQFSISGGEATAHAYAGYTQDGDARDNRLDISGGTGDVWAYAGYTEKGDVRGNRIDVSGGTGNVRTYAGYTQSGDAIANQATVTGVSGESYYYGGYTEKGDARDNRLDISGVILPSNFNGAYAGRTQDGEAAANQLSVNGATIGGQIISGHATSDRPQAEARAVGNTLSLEGGVFGDWTDFYAGSALARGAQAKASVSGNTLTVTGNWGSGGHLSSASGIANAYGAGAEVELTNNLLYFNWRTAGTGYSDFYSVNAAEGHVDGSGDVSARASGNKVIMVDANGFSADTISAYSGNASYYPGMSGALLEVISSNGVAQAHAEGNEVEISGLEEVSLEMAAGYAYTESGSASSLGSSIANNNKLTIHRFSRQVGNRFYGGYAEAGENTYYSPGAIGGNASANSNVVTIFASDSFNYDWSRDYVTGGSADAEGSGKAEALGNSVTMSGPSDIYSIVGGEAVGGRTWSGDYTGDAEASRNRVTLTNGVIANDFTGGTASGYNAAANGNYLFLDKVTASAYSIHWSAKYTGGYASAENNAFATGNTIEMLSTTIVRDADVYGGDVSTNNGRAEATGNTIILGRGLAPTALQNVTLHGGRVYISGTGTGDAVTGNTLKTQSQGLTANGIYNFEKLVFTPPRALAQGDVLLSLVNQTEDLNFQWINITLAPDGHQFDLNFNETATLLAITSGDKTISVSGLPVGVALAQLDGAVDGQVALAYTPSLPANKRLDITVDEKYLYGDDGDFSNNNGQRPTANTLELDRGQATAAFGGRAAAGNVTGNVAIMRGGELFELGNTANPRYPLSGNLYGGYADTGNALGNSVSLSGGRLRSAFGGWSDSGNAMGNTVLVEGGDLSGVIVGGGTDTGNATNNTVILRSSVNAALYGGYSSGGGAGDLVSGNSLEVLNKGLSANNISNFENLYFVLPGNTRPGEAMLTAVGGNPTRFVAPLTNVGVAVATNAPVLRPGDQVVLLRNTNGLVNASGSALQQGRDYQKSAFPGMLRSGQGFSLKYNFNLSNTETELLAGLTGENSIAVDLRTKALPKARLAAMSFLNRGTDQIDQALRQAVLASGGGDERGGLGLVPFAVSSGGLYRVYTGSYADVAGASFAAGLIGRGRCSWASLALGPFFEYGNARMDTHYNSPDGKVDGRGHVSYTGGGIMGRLELKGGSPLRGTYVEGSFRLGEMKEDWHSNDLSNIDDGRRASYDLHTPYHGAHAGLGHVWASEELRLDVYGKYFYTHMDGADKSIAGNPWHFHPVDSHRLHLGAHVDWMAFENASLYAGAAWEREFSATARATAYGLAVPAPSLKGDTGVFDAGVRWYPTENLNLDLGASGWAGKRAGIAGNLSLSYSF